jgi:N utilization substance protein B
MTRRSRAREVTLQLLYQRDFQPDLPRDDVQQFIQDRLRGEDLRSYALGLYDGVVAHLPDIDDKLSRAAENWRLNRMPVVDRNILRLGAYELLCSSDTPAAVAFDEAIELAKRYGTGESPAFINGVLDQLRKTEPRKEEG